MSKSDTRLSRIIQEIAKNLDADGTWTLSLNTLGNILEKDQAELYRELYKLHTSLGTEVVLEEFNEIHTGELLFLLESFSVAGAEKEFAYAGIYLDSSFQNSLIDQFLEIIKRKTLSHTVDYRQFEYLVSKHNHPRLAASLYIQQNFNFNEFISIAIDEFLSVHKFVYAEAAYYVAEVFLNRMLALKKTNYSFFCTKIFEELLDYFYTVMYPDEMEIKIDNLPDGVSDALKTMELKPHNLTDKVLKQKYYTLIKRYHPDLHIDGEEKAREIIGAYAILRSFMEDQNLH